MKRKKVAFCYSGCFRNFPEVIDQHLKFSDFLLEKWGIEADIYRFACFWSFNQLTSNWCDGKFQKYLKQNDIVDYDEERHKYPSKVNVPVRSEDIECIMSDSRCNWASYRFEPFQVYLNLEQHYPYAISQKFSVHYTMKKVMALRRKYEQQNNLHFDIVVWLRSDKHYGPQLDECVLPLPRKNKLEIFGETLPLVNPDIYVKVNLAPAMGFRDMFFYGNSHSVDVAVNCYSEPLEDLIFSNYQNEGIRGVYYPIEEHFYTVLTENGINVRHVPLKVTDWLEWQLSYFKLKEDLQVVV